MSYNKKRVQDSFLGTGPNMNALVAAFCKMFLQKEESAARAVIKDKDLMPQKMWLWMHVAWLEVHTTMKPLVKTVCFDVQQAAWMFQRVRS